MRRLCFDQGAGYRASPLRADLRQVICDRITELGKKTWPCFKEPTAEQSAEVESSTTLEEFLIDLEEGILPSRIVDAQSSSEAQEHASPHDPRDDDAFGASASCTGDVQGAGASRSATVLLDTTDTFGPATRAGSEADDDDDGDGDDNPHGADLREQPGDEDDKGDSMDSGILEALRNDEDDVYTHQMSRMFISAINEYRVADHVVVDSMAQCQALERHFTSCFKFPELVGFLLVPKYHAVDHLPCTYANEQAIHILGIDATKTYHQPYTFWGMMRALGLIAKILLSRSESWVVHSSPKMPFNVFDETGKAVIRFQDVWGVLEMFGNDCFPVFFSPAGENELLRQPGPVTGLPDSPAAL
jgi:hypothetical protein